MQIVRELLRVAVYSNFVNQSHTTYTNLEVFLSCFSHFSYMEVTAVFLIQLES